MLSKILSAFKRTNTTPEAAKESARTAAPVAAAQAPPTPVSEIKVPEVSPPAPAEPAQVAAPKLAELRSYGLPRLSSLKQASPVIPDKRLKSVKSPAITAAA